MLLTYELEISNEQTDDRENTTVNFLVPEGISNCILQINDGAGYTLTHSQKKLSMNYNYMTEKVIWYSKDSVYKIFPIYFLADWRQSNYEIRKKKLSFLEKAGVKTPIADLQNLETALGIELPENNVRSNIDAKPKKDSLIFYCEKKAITRVHFSVQKLTDVYKENYRLFLTYHLNIHPFVIEKIISDGRVPDYIEYYFTYEGIKTTGKMLVESIEIEVEPLPEFEIDTMKWTHRDLNQVYGIMDTMNHYVHVQEPLLPDSNKYLGISDSIAETGDHLGSLLCLLEYMMSSGIQPINNIKQMMAFQNEEADSSLKRYLLATEKPSSETDRKLKVERLEELTALSIPFGYIMHITAGNWEVDINPDKALMHYYEALSNAPAITALYMDIAQALSKKMNYTDAWICYEIAGLLNPDHPLSKKIQSQKQQLKKKFSNYFSKS